MSKTRATTPTAMPPASGATRPTGGGSFIRDRKTGALTRVDGRESAAPEPSGDAGNQSQEG